MIEIEQKYIRVNTPLYVMEDFYYDVLNRINKTIYEHDKLYGPKDFFSQVFKIDIKIDYRKDILKKLEKDVSIFISVFHFFWEEDNIIIDSRGYKFLSNDNYNRFRDAYSEGMYDLLNSLFLLSIGSPIQSTTLVRRAFEGLLKEFYNIVKSDTASANDNDNNKEKKGSDIEDMSRLRVILKNIFENKDITKLFDENNRYKDLQEFLESQLTSLEMKQAYDEIKSKIEKNRGENKVGTNMYFIYQRLCDYTHIYEKIYKDGEKNKEVIIPIHAHEPTFDNFDEPNNLFNLICGLYIIFLVVSIELLHNNQEIADKEYNEIKERFNQ